MENQILGIGIEHWKLIITALSPAVTAIGFVFLYKQLRINGNQLKISLDNANLAQENANLLKQEYVESQKWKQIEFVAEQIDHFFDDQDNRIVMKILDWRKRSVVLTIGNTTKVVKIDRTIFKSALRTADLSPVFSAEEASIRDLFDHFLSELGHFSHYINAGAIRKENIDPYIKYWMDLLHGRKLNIMDQDTVACIWRYLKFYNFQSAMELLLMYGPEPKYNDTGESEAFSLENDKTER